MFYKVPFSAVPDLVARRQVLLRGGAAYVGEAQVREHVLASACGASSSPRPNLCARLQTCPPPPKNTHTHTHTHHNPHTPRTRTACGCPQVGSLVVGCFRMHLSAALTEAAWAWGAFTAAEADRLAPLVDALPSRCVLRGVGAACGASACHHLAPPCTPHAQTSPPPIHAHERTHTHGRTHARTRRRRHQEPVRVQRPQPADGRDQRGAAGGPGRGPPLPAVHVCDV
jgi:hypothetical protein